jgi:hypothetical protein
MRMHRLAVILFVAIVISECTVSVLPVYAVDLNGALSSQGSPEKPTYKFQETVFINYPDGGKLENLLNHKNMTVSFLVDSTNPSVQNLVNRINADLLQNQKSPTRVTNLIISYTASLLGSDTSATVDYKLVLIPTITNYVLTKGSDNQTILDAGWMGMSIAGPVNINATQYGTVDINTPYSILQKIVPDIHLQIAGTPAEQVLSNSLMDSSSIMQHPISDWQHLFDPSYTIVETNSWGYNGTKVPITTYTVGESVLGQSLNPTENTVNFSLDKDYQVQTIQHASSATIQVDGVAQLETVGDQLAFLTSPQTTKIILPSSGLSIQVIYAMAGFGAVIAVGIFVWSNKKMKEVVTNIDTGPLQYETRLHWADRFGGTRENQNDKRRARSPV